MIDGRGAQGEAAGEFSMLGVIRQFIREDEGQDLIEYAFLAAFIALAVIAAAADEAAVQMASGNEIVQRSDSTFGIQPGSVPSSAAQMIRSMTWTVSIGWAPMAVSAESITASAPS